MKLRPAQATDQETIVAIIHEADINPRDLDWRRFLIAEEDGLVVGIGQIKLHGDGSRELASLAVIPSRRGQGIGSEIIRALLAKESGTLYLTCRAQLEPYYTRFGFHRIERNEMTPYFRRLMRVARFLLPIFARGVQIIIMKKG